MDKVYLERPNVCELLQSHIKSYRKDHPRLSGAQIARRFGVTTSTLGRIENGDIKTPTIDQAVKILRACVGAEAVADFMRTYYPDIHHGLLDYFKMSSERVELDEDIEQYFCDESTYMMMLFATTKRGLSENWVLQEYGRSGHQKFMKLAAKGVFKNKDGRFFASEMAAAISVHSNFKIMEFINKKAAEEVLSLNAADSTKSYFEYNNVNFVKISSQIKQILDDCKYEISALLNKPDNAGNDIVIVNNLLKVIKETK